MKKDKVSVVITTRNRSQELKHCIGSLVAQSRKLDELVIVDNNSQDDTNRCVSNIAQHVSFPIRYVIEEKVGYPHVYNRGLDEASNEWVAFIDDDCIADLDWYKRITFLVSNLSSVDVILGRSTEYNTKSIMALTKDFIDDIGKIGAIKNNKIVDFEILDSKNIVYRKRFLDDNNIRFDVGLLNYGQGASEDCDLGMQIMKHKGKAIYDKKVHVRHKDPVSFINYYKKAHFTLRNHLIFEKKWSRFRKKIRIQRTLKGKLHLFRDFSKKYMLDHKTQLLIFCNVMLTFIFIKILRFTYKYHIRKLQIPYA